jgi:NAD(P)-dependent dehydrogenase (short-subunit alcohol dehydrogenase family)
MSITSIFSVCYSGHDILSDGYVTETDCPCILVNNAGDARNTPLMEVEAEQLGYEFAVNVFGVIYLIQAVVGVGKMPKGGRIINIGSIASKILVPDSPVYAAAKAAQDALTTLWAGEVSFLGVFF